MKYNFEPAKNGLLTAYVESGDKRQYLHSKFVPEREGDLFAGIDIENNVVVLFGLSLGYHLWGRENVRKKCSHLFIVDPLPFCEQNKSQKDLSWIFSEKVTLLCGINENDAVKVIAEKAVSVGSSLQIVRHAASVNIFKNYFVELERLLVEGISQMVSANKTRNHFAKQFFRNGCKTLQCIRGAKDFALLKNKFGEFEAIVVSSGPSLDTFVKQLAKIQRDLFIIAVDSAIPVLANHGIDADIVVSVDPQVWVSEHCQKTRAVHIRAFTAYHSMRGEGESFIIMNSHPLSQICSRVNNRDTIATTGNVAGDALSCALMLGFKRIWMTGVDFSFPHYSIYAKGTAYYKRFCAVADRLSTVESKEMEYIRRGRSVTEKGVHTRRAFLDFKAKMESLIERCDAEIFHLVGEGLPVNGSHVVGEIELEQLFSGTKLCDDALSGRGVNTELQEKSSGQTVDSINSENCKKKRFLSSVVSGIPPLFEDAILRENFFTLLSGNEIQEQIFAESGVDKERSARVFDYFVRGIKE